MDSMVSIIIPVYNEEEYIEKNIYNIKALLGNYEAIFVDCGSTDKTVEIIKGHFPVAISPKKGRACQMNYGARMAKGDILLFLHCDSTISKNVIKEINETLDLGYKAGCFKIIFDSNSLIMKICGIMSSLRVNYRGIAFGDQGIFIQKEYFNSLGGFKEIPIMEDYRLSMDIKSDGQRIKLCDSYITTSERRFLKHGRLKTMWLMQKLQYMYRKGVNTQVIAGLYK